MRFAIKRSLCGICLAALAGQVSAAISGTSGYAVETYYAHPHADEVMVSFDWDNNANLYYSTGNPDWDLGFAVYRHDGHTLTPLYADPAAFAGGQVTAIGDWIYFNDGGTYERWTYDYFRYDPGHPARPTNLGITSDLWGLETRDGTDVWATGGWSSAIYHSTLNAAGDWINNPLVNLGDIGSASGPLAFDPAGNLLYTEGYTTNLTGAKVYRWTAADVAAALADPIGAPLNPAGHAWTTLGTGDGCTGMVTDDDGNVVVTATSFIDPSELQRLLMFNGGCIGYEVLARSDERLAALRMRDGCLYASSAAGIFTVTPTDTLRIVAQAGTGGAVAMLGLNDAGQAMRVNVIAEAAPQWSVRSMDGNRVLLQQGTGGAVAIAELNAAGAVINFTGIVASAPGWIARALDGNRILAQAGDGGATGIQQLGPGYTPGDFTLVMNPMPGWIARDLDDRHLLAQAGDGGVIVVVQLDASGAPGTVHPVSDPVPGRIARALCGNLLLTQTGDGGRTEILELDATGQPVGQRLVLNPLPGWIFQGLDVQPSANH